MRLLKPSVQVVDLLCVPSVTVAALNCPKSCRYTHVVMGSDWAVLPWKNGTFPRRHEKHYPLVRALLLILGTDLMSLMSGVPSAPLQAAAVR